MRVLDWLRSASEETDEKSHNVVQETERFEKSSIGSAQVSVTYRCTKCGEEHNESDVFSKVCGDGNYNTGGDVTQEPITALVQDSTNRYVKIRLILENGQNESMIINRNHPEYSTNRRKEIASLEEGEYIRTYLVSVNAERTAWRFGKIVERDLHG